MKRIKSILIVVLIFLSGVFVGGTVGSSVTIVDVSNRIIRGGPASIRKVLVQRARNEFKLDEDQSHQVWQILNDTGLELQEAVKPVRPKIDATLDRSASRIRAVLKPEQRARFDNFAKEARTRWQVMPSETTALNSEAEAAKDR